MCLAGCTLYILLKNLENGSGFKKKLLISICMQHLWSLVACGGCLQLSGGLQTRPNDPPAAVAIAAAAQFRDYDDYLLLVVLLVLLLPLCGTAVAVVARQCVFQNETPMVTKYIVVSKRAGRISCAESQTAWRSSVCRAERLSKCGGWVSELEAACSIQASLGCLVAWLLASFSQIVYVALHTILLLLFVLDRAVGTSENQGGSKQL